MKMKLAVLIILVLAISCGDKPESGPVKIYYGEDICERCKMIISEKDFAAQYKLSNGETVKFDDLGCMIQYTHDTEKTPISEVYVVDYSSEDWIDGRKAYYIWTQNINTPMGYGLLAFKERLKAEDHSHKDNSRYLGGQKEAYDWFLSGSK
ncbi:MAG: hypothetical protein DHS20C13_12640 [Thermodesulfobacteriota bacterium]|nr:MAG: hypothetical protein DHS20C13_12640 [Thermodesulfobacteriota bacterium]